MSKINSVTIAASTYGVIPRISGWIQSVWNNLEGNDYFINNKIQMQVLVVDDGTPNEAATRLRAQYCQKFNVRYLLNEKNLGIPATWNRIFRESGTDLVVCFNDDIRMLAPGWLSRLIYVFEHNDHIGGVGLPLVNETGFNWNDPRWDVSPSKVGAAIGCSFALMPSVLFQVQNPDESFGFFSRLRSFHEETTAGFKLAELGYDSFMLPWPPCHHMGGATFQANPELVWMEPDPYVPMDEFLKYVRSLPWYIPEYEEYYSKGKVDRMSFSRAMMAKIWGILDMDPMQEIPGEGMVNIWAEPQRWIHYKVVTPRPKRPFRWLDREGKEREESNF